MASNIGEVTVKVNLEASEELRTFIRAEVRKALQELTRDMRISSGPRAYTPPHMEVKDAAGKLPAYARYEEGTGGQTE